jgi:hypothetical protein
MDRVVLDEVATRAGRFIGIGDKVYGRRCRFFSRLTDGDLDELLDAGTLTAPWPGASENRVEEAAA